MNNLITCETIEYNHILYYLKVIYVVYDNKK